MRRRSRRRPAGGASRPDATPCGASARHRLATVSVVVLALLALSILVGPLLWRVPINEIDFTARLSPPSWDHPFGTDDLGQDLLSRMIYGGRISLAVGFAAMAVALFVGHRDRRASPASRAASSMRR